MQYDILKNMVYLTFYIFRSITQIIKENVNCATDSLVELWTLNVSILTKVRFIEQRY